MKSRHKRPHRPAHQRQRKSLPDVGQEDEPAAAQAAKRHRAFAQHIEVVQTGLAHRAQKLVAAIAASLVGMTGCITLLPRVLRCLKGWQRLCPPCSRLPYPWVGLLLMYNRLVCQGPLVEARAKVLTVILYLRPSETPLLPTTYAR